MGKRDILMTKIRLYIIVHCTYVHVHNMLYNSIGFSSDFSALYQGINKKSKSLKGNFRKTKAKNNAALELLTTSLAVYMYVM